jgi:hypothetical protein
MSKKILSILPCSDHFNPVKMDKIDNSWPGNYPCSERALDDREAAAALTQVPHRLHAPNTQPVETLLQGLSKFTQ